MLNFEFVIIRDCSSLVKLQQMLKFSAAGQRLTAFQLWRCTSTKSPPPPARSIFSWLEQTRRGTKILCCEYVSDEMSNHVFTSIREQEFKMAWWSWPFVNSSILIAQRRRQERNLDYWERAIFINALESRLVLVKFCRLSLPHMHVILYFSAQTQL